MPQLHFYVPEETAKALRRKAKQEGLSLSKYISTVVSKETKDKGWPPGYLEWLSNREPSDIELPDDPPVMPGDDPELRFD